MTMRTDHPDFADVRGNREAVLGLEHAVASYLRGEAPVVVLCGPPGTGKTMLARRIVTLLPDPTLLEQVWIEAEFTGTYASASVYRDAMRSRHSARPFRAPHHTVSAAALSGPVTRGYYGIPNAACRCKQSINGDCQWHTLPKAVVPHAGELQLARFGVLFLDELPEFTLLSLRTLGAGLRAMAPSVRPMVIAAANPCPCGWLGSATRECTCSPEARARYNKRCLEAMLALKHGGHAGETIEIPVQSVPFADLRRETPSEPSAAIRARIEASVGGGS